MTRSIIRTGESLNHLGTLAQEWFKKAADAPALTLRARLDAVDEALRLAERFCAAVACPLDVIIEHASGRPSSSDPFLRVPSTLSKALDLKIRDIDVDNTRYTTKSRAKWGLELVRYVATFSRFNDSKLFDAAARRFRGQDLPPGDGRNTPIPLMEPDTSPITAIDAQIAAELVQDCTIVFRKYLITSDSAKRLLDPQSTIPDNFGIDLKRLHRLTQKITIKYSVRRSLDQSFEPATPLIVQVDYGALPAYQTLTGPAHLDAADPRLSASGIISSSDCAAVNTDQHFPSPQWNAPHPRPETVDLKRYRRTVSNIKRKRVVITDSEYQFVFTYGVLHKIESEVASGGSVLVIAISGTGKSTILDKMPLSGSTVFQLGGTLDPSRPKHHVFTVAQAEEMIRQAKRTKGRKILIAHELFIGPKMLEELGDFDQFAFVGDPMQPGSCADAEHLFQFMRDIGGKTFTLSVVWRASNPLMMMSLNYLAYGSKYKICTRNFSPDDRQFEIIVCDDDVTIIAANMLAHALKKANGNRSVIIGAGSQGLINALKSLLALTSNCPDSICCRHLLDLQGREADVLIIDLHDVAVCYPEPDDALRFFYMLLGRARHTTVFALGKRNMCSDPQLALPVEVYAGVVLRHRVRSTESVSLKYAGKHFQQLEKTYNLVLFDEETIAMMVAASGVTYIILIKNRHSHNALMLKNLYLVIEATDFFEEAENVDLQCELLNHFVDKFYLPPKGRIYSFHEIRSFISSQRK